MLATDGGTESGLSSMKFKAVIFDMDGVLVDSEPLHQKAWQQILDGFGISFGKLAIASSAIRKNVEAVIECIQLQKLFQSVLSIEDVSSPKPHPEIYLKSAENLQVAPFECAVIEDSVPGLQAAKGSGAFAIGITTSFPAEVLIAADWIAHSFSEIKSFLETRLA